MARRVMFQPDELLIKLSNARVEFIVIGGVAVGVHGFVRATKDLDIVPAPTTANLERLAQVLTEIHAAHVGAGEFTPEEFPYDPTDPHQLAQGANFRLDTDLGPLDIMQWMSGIDADLAYSALSDQALKVRFRDAEIRVCSLEHLRAMKTAAGRPQDLQDLQELDSA